MKTLKHGSCQFPVQRLVRPITNTIENTCVTMTKLLIRIGQYQRFDLESTIRAITAINGVSNVRRENSIGAVFECNYSYAGRITVVRISEDLETVTVEGLGEESTDFAVKLQQCIPQPLHVIDIDYSFDLGLSEFKSGAELMSAIEQE